MDDEAQPLAEWEWRRVQATGAAYGPYFLGVLAILAENDVMGLGEIVGSYWRTEYVPEARTIAPRLHPDMTIQGVRQVVGEEFDRWFGATNVSSSALDSVAQGIAPLLHTDCGDQGAKT